MTTKTKITKTKKRKMSMWFYDGRAFTADRGNDHWSGSAVIEIGSGLQLRIGTPTNRDSRKRWTRAALKAAIVEAVQKHVR